MQYGKLMGRFSRNLQIKLLDTYILFDKKDHVKQNIATRTKFLPSSFVIRFKDDESTLTSLNS